MKKILAISDTHLQEDSAVPGPLIDLAKGADLLLHAGDFVSPGAYEAFRDLAPFEAVSGNSDDPAVAALLPQRRVVEVEDVRIGLVHRAAFSADLLGADLLAREMEVDALVFGHLHRPVLEARDRLLICPGSPTEPRLSPPAVAVLEVEGRRVLGRIVPLGRPVCGYFRFAEALSERSVREEHEKTI